MHTYTEELKSNRARIRFDVVSAEPKSFIVEDDTFLNYRLGAVEVEKNATKDRPDIIWFPDEQKKGINYEDLQLTLRGRWEEGELNKIMVTMLANEMDLSGLHPFHSSAVNYKGKTILLVGGENNHGKSMSQLEGCRRGGKIFSTETTVTDDTGLALYGSKNVYIRKRAKGTERSDLPSQDEGVLKFWDREPAMEYIDGPLKIDLAVMPGIDGHFDTQVKEMAIFERCYQSFHSVMNFFGLNQLLDGENGLVMPIVDSNERRQARGAFIRRFCDDLPFYMIRARTPQILFDEVEKILDNL